MTQEATDSRHTHSGAFAGMHSHEDGALHWHDEFGEHSAEELDPEEEAIRQHDWKVSNVVVVTVGVDIGSSTSHLMFSRVHMQRMGEGAATRFVAVGREVLWKSPIIFTPYIDADTIDADRLEKFLVLAYREVGAGPADVDSGAVILTGEALKRKNARAIGELFAKEIGKFVCAGAGHHLEAVLAANGSGTVSRSRRDRQTLLNVDIGGGTTKLALVRDGEIVSTAAIAVGARAFVKDSQRRLTRLDDAGRRVAEHLGLNLAVGELFSEEAEKLVAEEWTNILAGLIRREPPAGIAADLMLTEPLQSDAVPQAVTFSGGVSEFVYLREAHDFGDMGPALAKMLRRALMTGAITLPVVDPGQGIRATAIGASQFAVQVSGDIYVSDESILPLQNLPVILPAVDLSGEIRPLSVASAIREAATRADFEEGEQPLAVAIHWEGEPTEARVRALAEGIRDGIPRTIEGGVPFAVLADFDIGKTVGRILKEDLSVPGNLVSLDGVAVREFDFVDIAEVMHPAEVIPVVIKALLFAGGLDRRSIARALAQAKSEIVRAGG